MLNQIFDAFTLMVKPTSQTEDTDIPSSEEEGVLDRVKRILSPFKRDRWLAVAVYGSLTTIGLAIGTLAWNWSDLQTNPSEQSKKRFDASLSFVTNIAAIGGGIFVFLNFTVAKDKLDQEIAKAKQDAELAQKKLEQDREKAERDERLAQSRLKMERFSKAVEMLGNNSSIHVRLGGIYALESIAADSNNDAPDENYRQVLEVLTAFVRENAPYPPKEQAKNEKQPQPTEQPIKAGGKATEEISSLPIDIQAVLTVLNRRNHRDKDWQQYPLDLKKTDLRKASLERANLQEAFLERANLKQANLWEVNLQDADLEGAYLQKTNLEGAYLQRTNLEGAYLQQAELRKAHLQGANLEGAYLQKTNLEGADLQDAGFFGANLQQANLKGANLQLAYFVGADLQKADLEGANLQDANLEGANLQQANIRGANLRGVCFWNSWNLKLTETQRAEAENEARVNLQSAKNWEETEYDPEICELLGLSPESSEAE